MIIVQEEPFGESYLSSRSDIGLTLYLELTRSAKIIKAPLRKLAAREWEKKKRETVPARL